MRNVRITAVGGIGYNNQHFNLSAMIVVGYQFNSERAVQFRKWATQIVQEFVIKGFAMDDERLKNLSGLGFCKEILYRMREIPSREKVMHRQLLDFEQHSVRNESLGKNNSSSIKLHSDRNAS